MQNRFRESLCIGAALLGSTVLCSNAIGAEWKVQVSGYGEFYTAFAASDVETLIGEDFNGIDFKQDVEIAFKPSIILDNGIKIGANIQLEGNSDDDQIDESYLFIETEYGELVLGSENSAGFLLHVRAPNALWLDPDDLDEFIPFSGNVGVNVGDDRSRGTLGETLLENDRNNDAQRITYYTPDLYGLTLGLSYARDGRQDDNTQVDRDVEDISDIFDVGLVYEREFGDFGIAVSGRWGIAQAAAGGNPTIWGAGLQLGYGGFTIGGSFAEQNESGTEDGTGFDVGVSYKTGPWGFSVAWHHGENVDDEQPFPGADEELDVIMAGVTYKPAKGVTLLAFGGYADFEEDQGDATLQGDNVDGFAIGTGIKISF